MIVIFRQIFRAMSEVWSAAQKRAETAVQRLPYGTNISELVLGESPQMGRRTHGMENTVTASAHNVTDDSLVVRQITQYQFTWYAGNGNEPGTHVLQL